MESEITKEEFQATFNDWTQEICDEDVAIMLQVSVSTIRRWRSGANAPHRFMRKSILDELKKEIMEDQA